MRLLVLGGTKFLGRAAVEAALARRHEVTLFNRGETNPELFPDAEKLRGDRDGDLTALEGRAWDAVIDPSGYVPRVVRASAELLQGSAGHYLFVSMRLSLGGEVLAPAPPERLVELIDVRDLGNWLVEGCERRASGTFNASSEPVTFGEVLAACGDAEPVWVDEQFLLDHGVGQWMELPLWIAGSEGDFLQMSVAKAVDAGLGFRPLEETARDTLAWARATGAQLVTSTPYGAAGLDPAKEAKVLEAWRAR